MKRNAQIILVSISILFSLVQAIFFGEYHFLDITECLVATLIAWIVGWQYDKLRLFAKERKESEQNYKKLIEWLPKPVIIHQDSIILFVNKAAEKMIAAHNKNELIGRSIYDFLIFDSNNDIKEIRKGLQKNVATSSIVVRLKRLDGKIIFFEVTSELSQFEGKEIILSIGKDVTDDKKQTDSLLLKSEKLALVGQMAAGIAHEIRNPLTSIKGFIQLFRSNIYQKEYYDIVLSELERINHILGEFLVLAKPSITVFEENEIEPLIKDVVTLVNTQSIMNSAQIIVEISPELPTILCEKNQLKQVLINLLKNAIEAMPNGGLIKINAQMKSPNQISISVNDHGVGIPKERIPTLGEPFYTTKEKGTGLGLMTCFKIIESHHGELIIESEEGIGTTIEIILPISFQPFFSTLSS
ncbi:ATP-binding protein [Heyndrickxia oleronia]|uniref:ATP-binding protein n=1 Tax=Heyndrickxia oleronia TaxID=38875 RepID=UPI00203E8B32|nr:ATP-binding protein [Heyndrickxia oleronia]MCM3239013.1 ATP-binding protein [Heyndrickxia oleronia]